MDEGMILLILNVFFAFVLVCGFLSGFIKGVKRAGLRIAFYFVAILISAIIAPLLAKMVLGINITYKGEKMSISNVILTIINNSEQVKEIVEASPSLKTLIQNLPLMVGNVVMFMVSTAVLGFLSYILYLIVASAVFKGDKKVNKAGNVVRKSKKYRLFGGVVGTLQAVVFLFLLFLPVSGVVGIITDVTQEQQEVAAETEYLYAESEDQSSTAKLIDNYMPDQVKIIINAFNKSAVCKMSSVGNLDDAMFNSISAVKVNGTKLFLRDEVINIAKVYDNIGFVFDLDLSDLNNLKTVDYDKLITAVNYAFNSKILKTTLPEVTEYAFNKVLANHTIADSAEYTELVTAIKNEMLDDERVVDNLKDDVISVLKTLKVTAKSKIMDNVPLNREREMTNDDVKAILNILSKDQKQVLGEIVDEMLNSKVLNKVMLFALNKGVEFVDEKLEPQEGIEKVTISKIDLNDNEIKLKKAEIKSLLSSVVNILNETIDADFDAIKDDFKLIFDLNTNVIVNNLGSMMNAVQNMSVFSQTGIYNDILDMLATTKYSKYVNFEVFKQQNIWINEATLLSESIDKLVESQALSYVIKNDDGYSISKTNINAMLDKLTEIKNVNGQNKTQIRQIIEPLYNSESLKQLVRFGLDKLEDKLNEFGKQLGEDVDLGEINYKNLYSELERENLFALVDNVCLYVKDLDIEKLQNDAFLTLLESNIARLGNCLDSLKRTSLFADIIEDGETKNGIYSNLVNALKNTSYSNYLNFDVFKQDGFSFNSEFSNLQSTIELLKTKKIVEQDKEYSLIQYIVSDGDWEIILKQISKDELRSIFTPLMESKLFEPIGTMVINKINEQIKNIVGEIGEYINVDLDVQELTQEEIEEIIDIVETITEIIEEVTQPDFQLTDLIDGDKAEFLAKLLTELQENANNDGVFADAYNALLEYAKSNEEISEQLTQELDNYPEGEIDWYEVVDNLKERM